MTPRLLAAVDPASISFSAPQKHGPIYVMRPLEQVLLQTPSMPCAADLRAGDRKLQVFLDAATDAWVRAFEESFKEFAKANTVALFEKELDPEFIDESFRSCLPQQGASAPLPVTLTEDACVFEHTREKVEREAVTAGKYVNLLLELTCIQFGKRWFTPKLRAVSVRIVPAPPPPKATPTYESVGWVDDDITTVPELDAVPLAAAAVLQQQRPVELLPSVAEEGDIDEDDQLSIDIDLDGIAPPTAEVAAWPASVSCCK